MAHIFKVLFTFFPVRPAHIITSLCFHQYTTRPTQAANHLAVHILLLPSYKWCYMAPWLLSWVTWYSSKSPVLMLPNSLLFFAGLIAAGGSIRPPGLCTAPQTLYSLTFSGAPQQAQSTHLPTAASHQTSLSFLKI